MYCFNGKTDGTRRDIPNSKRIYNGNVRLLGIGNSVLQDIVHCDFAESSRARVFATASDCGTIKEQKTKDRDAHDQRNVAEQLPRHFRTIQTGTLLENEVP
jgi:hypothetical protein